MDANNISASGVVPAAAPAALKASQNTEEAAKVVPKDLARDWAVIFAAAALSLIVLWVAKENNAVSLEFQANVKSVLPSVLGSFMLVSLLIERVIEVFVSVWCDPRSAAHQQNLAYWQARKGRLTGDIDKLTAERNADKPPSDPRKAEIDEEVKAKRVAVGEADAKTDMEEKVLVPFTTRTTRISTWFGLAIGILTSAVGFRLLSQLVVLKPIFDPPAEPGRPQYGWFLVVDVLLTGAVLAGGSKLVHQIFSVYSSFMDSTQKALSDKSKTP